MAGTLPNLVAVIQKLVFTVCGRDGWFVGRCYGLVKRQFLVTQTLGLEVHLTKTEVAGLVSLYFSILYTGKHFLYQNALLLALLMTNVTSFHPIQSSNTVTHNICFHFSKCYLPSTYFYIFYLFVFLFITRP